MTVDPENAAVSVCKLDNELYQLTIVF